MTAVMHIVKMVHKAQSPALLRSRLRRPISLHSQIIRQCRTSSTEWALRPTKFVVGVTGVTDATDIFNNSYETEGQGVGVILRDNGKQLIILTEKNVVDKADKLSVTFVNDMMADAALVKYDSNTGIAIISVDKSLLDDATTGAIAVAELGNSNIVSRGASVIALEANYAIPHRSCNVNNQRAVGAGQQLLGAHHRYRKQQVAERYTD